VAISRPNIQHKTKNRHGRSSRGFAYKVWADSPLIVSAMKRVLLLVLAMLLLSAADCSAPTPDPNACPQAANHLCTRDELPGVGAHQGGGNGNGGGGGGGHGHIG
jgi:hypothetical protein